MMTKYDKFNFYFSKQKQAHTFCCLYEIGQKKPLTKQKSYKCDNQLITWLTGITRPAGSCNLVTLKTNFAQYKNFVWNTVLYNC
jgi:hypothetical protein